MGEDVKDVQIRRLQEALKREEAIAEHATKLAFRLQRTKQRWKRQALRLWRERNGQ